MKKGRKADVVLEFLQWFDIKPVNAMSVAYQHFAEIMGDEKATRLNEIVLGRLDKAHDSDKALYLLKNEDIDAALKFTGDVDGDIIRHVCNWILSHKQCFGKTILEVGCDIGLISCFLAKTFPESKIIAIDRFSEGVAIAKQLAEELELNNIEFKCIDANSINEKYDTVFSCRTLHENRDIKENYYPLFRDYARQFKETTAPYAHVLSRLVKENGNLVTIERGDKNPLILGWMWALNDKGLVFNDIEHEELLCKEAGEISQLQACVFRHGESSEKEIYYKFLMLYENEFLSDKVTYKGWEAALLLENIKISFIAGIEARMPNSEQLVAQVMFFDNLEDNGSLMQYVYMINEGPIIYNLKADLRDTVVKRLALEKELMRKQGYAVKYVEEPF